MDALNFGRSIQLRTTGFDDDCALRGLDDTSRDFLETVAVQVHCTVLCLDPNLLGKGYPMASNGTVKFFNHTKGYGFIAPEDGGKDIFVHISALERAGLPPLNEGDRVSFEVEDDPRGRGKQATNIQMA